MSTQRDRDERMRPQRRVLAALDEALAEEEPLPPSLLAAASALYSWRNVEAQLLELLTDSAYDALLTVRAGEEARLLVFGSSELSVQVQVDRGGGGYRLSGFVTAPGSSALVRAEWDGGAEESRSDEAGHFQVGPAPAGRLRLVVRRGDEPEFVTPWFDVPV